MFKLVLISAILCLANAGIYHQEALPLHQEIQVPAAVSTSYRRDVIRKPEITEYTVPEVVGHKQLVEKIPAVYEKSLIPQAPIVQKSIIPSAPIVEKSFIPQAPIVERKIHAPVVAQPLVHSRAVLAEPLIQSRGLYAEPLVARSVLPAHGELFRSGLEYGLNGAGLYNGGNLYNGLVRSGLNYNLNGAFY